MMTSTDEPVLETEALLRSELEACSRTSAGCPNASIGS